MVLSLILGVDYLANLSVLNPLILATVVRGSTGRNYSADEEMGTDRVSDLPWVSSQSLSFLGQCFKVLSGDICVRIA